MNREQQEAWYCARTKPKHEHIAAGNLARQLALEVFLPRLRIERATRRGLVRSVDPLFPGYVFVRCVPELFSEIRYVSGVSTLVNFGGQIPAVPDTVVSELRECFESESPLPVENQLLPGAEVSIAEGAFRGFHAIVLRTLPARQRVQVLLDILGRQTLVEVDRHTVNLEHRNVADWLPALAAPNTANRLELEFTGK